MTRKQALIKALEIIELSQNTDEKELIIKHLQKIIDKECNTLWTKESILIAIDEWIKTHNRNPIHKDFLNEYYPSEFTNIQHRKCKSKYDYTTKEEWIKIFIEQYNEIKPLTARQYNAKRDSNTPTWNTISRYYSDGTWTGLILDTNVETKFLYRKVVYKKQELSINNSDLDLYSHYKNKIKNSSLKIVK